MAALVAGWRRVLLARPGITVRNGLVGYWPFDAATISGTTARDLSGNGRDGTLENSPTVVAGQIKDALQFNGVSSQAVNLGTVAALQPTAAGSFAAWIFPTVQTNHAVMGFENYALDRQGAMLWIDTNNQAVAELADASGAQQLGSGSGTIGLNAWNFVSMTWNGITLTIAVKSVRTSAAQTRTPIAGVNPTRIGAGGAASGFFTGRIDGPRIANRAWSPVEENAIYQAGLHHRP